MEIHNVFYRRTDKQSMFKHMSLCQGMHFSIGFQLGLTWEPGNDKQTMYFVFVIKTRHNSVSRGNSEITRKEMSNLFSCDCLIICRNVAREERNQEKNDGFWLQWGIFNEYIKQSIIMAVLRKGHFHSVDVCKLMKNQSCKKRSRKKTDSNFNLL